MIEVKLSTHTCVLCGRMWQRRVVRGQRPKTCPECRDRGRGGVPRKLVVVTRTCFVCGERFQSRANTQTKYCGEECRRIARVGDCYPSREEWDRIQGEARAQEQIRNGWRAIVERGDRDAMVAYLWDGRVRRDGDCWVWTQQVDKNGYPKKGGTNSVHRDVYRACNGGIPKGDHVHHKCANPLCLNPDHLALSTARENIGEMLARRAYEERIKHLEELAARMAEALGCEHPLYEEWKTTTAKGLNVRFV